MVRFRSRSLGRLVTIGCAPIGWGLLPWTIFLAVSLNPRHETTHWDLAWSGFDTALAVMFVATSIAAWRRSPGVGLTSGASGTWLVTDRWFDIILESHADELRIAIFFAAVAELPVAALCFWIAYRTEH